MELDCNSVIDSAFEERMNNWRRTVIYSGRRNSNCAWWAEIYAGLQRLAGPDSDAPPQAISSTDHQDGWQVEAAWRALRDANEKQVLKYWFVFQYSEHRIKRQMLIRRKGLKEILEKAKNNLQKELDKLAQLKLNK